VGGDEGTGPYGVLSCQVKEELTILRFTLKRGSNVLQPSVVPFVALSLLLVLVVLKPILAHIGGKGRRGPFLEAVVRP
jgi:hypothetical protein